MCQVTTPTSSPLDPLVPSPRRSVVPPRHQGNDKNEGTHHHSEEPFNGWSWVDFIHATREPSLLVVSKKNPCHPSEKYAAYKLDHSPKIGVKIKNVSNHLEKSFRLVGGEALRNPKCSASLIGDLRKKLRVFTSGCRHGPPQRNQII